ncbi:MAG: hypothetical protein CL927_18010 [Deltaproteobacteria bacterium]|nr:hypothetical protein [Deltaproteobacteria bacterium]HCH66532.1 hypothetical protein [Deltaproteobacteria bacterium]
MHALYIEGLLLGVVCASFVGPVLFTLLDASLQGGFRAGARVALGIAVSDAVAIALILAGLGPVLTHPVGAQALSVVGGLVLLAFGAVLFARAHPAPRAASAYRDRPFWAGFVVNFVNPFVFGFWVGAAGGIGARHDWSPAAMVPVFGGMLTTIFVTDLLKAAAASRLSRHLNGPFMTLARRVSGLMLAIAGLALLLRPFLLPVLES